MAEILHQLEITTLTQGGRGLGRYDGKAVFVPLTAPGDIVTCKIVRNKKRYIEAELLEVSTPSLSRRDAPCPYFGECGGCQWQHLPYDEQVRWKTRLFADQLVRNSLAGEKHLHPAVRSGEEWFYRIRVQFKCSNSAQEQRIGFYRHGSHDVVDIDRCLLLVPRIQEAYTLLRGNLSACPCPESVHQVDMAAGDDDEVRLVFHLQDDADDDMSVWLRSFAEQQRFNVCIRAAHKEALKVVVGKPSLSLRIDKPEIKLEYGPQGFAQINSRQNRAMIQEMLALLAGCRVKIALDLFCGMGNFSLPLAAIAERVIGVEDHAQSIEYAKMNAANNAIHNVDFHAADAAAFIRKFNHGDIDLVVLDPPRTGHLQAVCEILKLMPDRILYISCDPATLARDLRPLVDAGYEIVSARPFDLFPQTWHIESMTLLRKARG